MSQLIQPFLQWGGLFFGLFNQSRYPSQLGIHTGRDHNCLTRTAVYRGPFVKHIGSLRQRNILLERVYPLCHRYRLTGQRRFIRL